MSAFRAWEDGSGVGIIIIIIIAYTVPIGYSDLGYSGRAAYSDLKPNGTWSSCTT